MPRIDQHASDAQSGLNRFIAIHDEIFAERFLKSLRRILPIPGIFQPIPYGRHAATLRVIREEISSISARCSEDLRHATCSPPERDALKALLAYCEAFERTLDALGMICVGLAREVETRAGPSFREYNASVKEYEQYRSESMAVGAELNATLARFRQRESGRRL